MTSGFGAAPLIAVLDYGIGNLRSAEKGLQKAGADARLTDDVAVIGEATGVVLPGVGAFGPCMTAMERTKLAPAARDDVQGRFRTGDAVGYAGDELVAWGAPEQVLRQTIELLAVGRELVTCIAGAEAPLGEDEVEQALPDGLELDFHQGGQPAWWYLLAVE